MCMFSQKWHSLPLTIIVTIDTAPFQYISLFHVLSEPIQLLVASYAISYLIGNHNALKIYLVKFVPLQDSKQEFLQVPNILIAYKLRNNWIPIIQLNLLQLQPKWIPITPKFNFGSKMQPETFESQKIRYFCRYFNPCFWPKFTHLTKCTLMILKFYYIAIIRHICQFDCLPPTLGAALL